MSIRNKNFLEVNKMKAFSVSKRLLSVLSLLLAIVMLFAACGPDENTSETSDPDDAQVSSEEDTADDNNESEEETQNDNQDGNNTSKQNTPTQSGKNDKLNNSNDATFYKSAPKGEIHILMWRNWHKSEKLLIDQYKKLTGVNVKTTVVAEGDYATKLVSMVTAKNSPDIVCLTSNNFPSLVTKAMQPLDPKDFQLDSDCWSKTLMDAYKINGRYFGVAMPKSWSCEDLNYVTYYNPTILKSFGVTTTPYQLYKQGKWNWETQSDIARKAKQAGKTGLALQSSDVFMHSAGQDFVSYDGKQFKNLLGGTGKANTLLVNAWSEVAKLQTDGAIGGWSTDFASGKIAMMTGIAYGLYNEGNWYTEAVGKTLEAVPVAGPKGSTAYTPIRPKTWGIPKKAKNAEGAAYFLRYFLDTSAFNFSSTFYNKQFEEVFNTITKASAKKSVMFGWGVSDYITPDTYNTICNELQKTTAKDIPSRIGQVGSTINSPVTRANKELKRIK